MYVPVYVKIRKIAKAVSRPFFGRLSEVVI